MRYSFDGENYSEKLHHMGVFDELLKKRYKGVLYLKYIFDVKSIPKNCSLLIENTNLLEVVLNGEKIDKTGVSHVEDQLFSYNCEKYVKVGNNEVILKIDYYQRDDVYYALFGENVTESLKNCLVYDTCIETIFLKGKFGVYGDFVKGKSDDILLGNNFYIDSQKKNITELITQGFPFFAGTIKLKQKVFVDSINKQLVINERFHLIDIKVNGKFVNRLMLTSKLCLQDYLNVGENELEIDLCVGNRNLLGPFHTFEQENYGVSPYTFERTGTWIDGKSSVFRENYSFIKNLI